MRRIRLFRRGGLASRILGSEKGARAAKALAAVLACGTIAPALLGIPLVQPGQAPEPAVQSQSPEAPSSSAQSADTGSWSEAEAPDYYRVVGKATVSDAPAAGEIVYSRLDSLGRTGRARAVLTPELRRQAKARGRQDLPQSVRPSGWGHNAWCEIQCPDGSVYRGMFWNRSHEIADSLGGDPVVENMVTGTRMQNVGGNGAGSEGGMAHCEAQARDWLDSHAAGELYYSVEPVYRGDEPVCRYSVVDMRSSDGRIDQRVYVYNAAKGYDIDYATGEWRAA